MTSGHLHVLLIKVIITVQVTMSVCPCTNHQTTTVQVPTFIGSNYFCDTRSEQEREYAILYHEDPGGIMLGVGVLAPAVPLITLHGS